MIPALLIALLLTAPKPAPAATADESGAVKKAKELFQSGQKLYKQARYAEAIAKFEEAYLVRPHPVIYFNIGKCWEQLGETAKALRAYRDYLRLAPDAKDKETVSDAIANLERRLREKGMQQLMVFADPPDARIAVDGKELGSSPASVELVAGNHTLTVSADGFEKVERSFVMQTTRATEMTISLRPAGTPVKEPVASDAPKLEPKTTTTQAGDPPPTPPLVVTPVETKKGRLWTYVAGGVAVASLGTAVGLGVASNGAMEQFTKVQEPHPPGEVQARFDAANQSASGLATGANVAYGVAGVAAATAIVLFFIEK
ncbi:MAG: PEGA domain-containing protein [Archangium sp.]|nr:PEGA domain-containing protein [Archangium sp.]MDP3574399.1 PEGA domain-containing protein [Archangium sp.]